MKDKVQISVTHSAGKVISPDYKPIGYKMLSLAAAVKRSEAKNRALRDRREL